MADVDVKKTSSRGTESGGGQELAGIRNRDPFAFSVNPNEFFSNPFGVMRRMSEEMDRTFNQLLSSSGGSAGTRRTGGWLPAIEVAQKGGELLVHAELPGLTPEDVKVEVTDGLLVIEGERKSEQEHRSGNMVRSERQYGRFYREVPLPEGVNAEQVKAQFRNGVLEVAVPIPQQTSNRRQIPIQSSEAIAGGQDSGQASGSAATAASAGSGGPGQSQVKAGSSDR